MSAAMKWFLGIVLAILFLFILVKCSSAEEHKPDNNLPVIRLCTGAEGGVYYESGKIIKKWALRKIDIQIVETEGTIDNIEQTRDGTCDAFIGQPDGLVEVAKKSRSIKDMIKPAGVLHTEYLHVLCNKDSDIDDLGGLEGTTKSLNIGPPGSGSWTTWQNLVTEDEGYKSIKTASDEANTALASVSAGDTDCMLVASGLHSGIMDSADADYNTTVSLVGANDKDFNDSLGIDGKPLYSYKDIASGTYPNLQTGFFGSSVSTITWKAQVYVNKESLDDKLIAKFIGIVAKASGEIRGKYDQ